VLTLCYHALYQVIVGFPYTTSAAAFDARITFLRDSFDSVPVQTAIDALGSGQLKTRARPMAVICFDDGYRCNWTQATPVLERHAVPAILFAPRDLIRQPGQTYLSESQLNDLAAHPYAEVEKARGSEQRYTSHKAMDNDCFAYIRPEWVVSFKYDCNPFPTNYFRAPRLPADARVVCFHGRPKMTDALTGYTGSLIRYAKPCAWLQEHWIDRSQADLGHDYA